jgi:mannosyltransferase
MRKLTKFTLPAVLVLAFLMRIVRLNQSLWLDEATSALVAKMSFPQIFQRFLPGDFHPPLYYIFLKIWSMVFGFSEVVLRIPSVIFGVLTVFLAYLIGRKIFNKKVALISSLLLATSGLHIYYSQEARMYALAAFLVSMAIYLFISEKWLLFSVFLGLIGMTDYVSCLILPALWVSAIVGKKDGPWWKKFLASHIPLVILFIWWFPTLLTQLRNGLSVSVSAPGWWNILGQVTIKNIALVPVKFIFGRISIDNKTVYGLVVGIVGALFLFLMLKAKRALFAWIWLGVCLILGVIFSLFIPTLSYFRYLFALPAFYLILASGITNIKKSWFALALIFAISVNLTSSVEYLTAPRFWREDWRSLVSFVESKKTAKSITIFVADANKEAYLYYAPNAKIAGPDGVKKGYDEIWLMRYIQGVFDPQDKARADIENLGYKKIDSYNFNGVEAWLYK